ncbi:MAG TPA: XdhC/CoxI family protein [Pyrinomonadaceae bacterium]|nr:XdhC/CoxI family protein [Pyrinomonadaceae bacterium]
MNEVRALVEAFDKAVDAGDSCALATIVSVEGSSYRRPGARMLICENGMTTGTISAGCLERDVIVHAERVIATGETKLVEYDNASTSDEMAWGLGLGCNGIVRVLIEPVTRDSPYIQALRESSEMRPDAPTILAATVYQGPVAAGARLFIRQEGEIKSEDLNGAGSAITREIQTIAESGTAFRDHTIEISGGAVKLFVEKLMPPVSLVIFGAGQDALPIVEYARGLGWQVEVVDPQAREVSRERFAMADRVTLARPEDVGSTVTITSRTLALVMSHDYRHDLAALEFLLASPARYIGVMGPRKRTERMLAELGMRDETELTRLHSPVGLDIGANGPVEIAFSIIAEMRAVLEGKRGGMLRDSRGPIQSTEPSANGNAPAVHV